MAGDNIMMGENNSIKICGMKELVVTGTVVLAVIGGVWFFGGVVLSANPKSYKRHCHPKCHG